MDDVNFSVLRAFLQSECAAEFLKQGELLARKRPELRHAILTHRRPIDVSPFGQKLRFCPIPLRTLGGFADSRVAREFPEFVNRK